MNTDDRLLNREALVRLLLKKHSESVKRSPADETLSVADILDEFVPCSAEVKEDWKRLMKGSPTIQGASLESYFAPAAIRLSTQSSTVLSMVLMEVSVIFSLALESMTSEDMRLAEEAGLHRTPPAPEANEKSVREFVYSFRTKPTKKAILVGPESIDEFVKQALVVFKTAAEVFAVKLGIVTAKQGTDYAKLEEIFLARFALFFPLMLSIFHRYLFVDEIDAHPQWMQLAEFRIASYYTLLSRIRAGNIQVKGPITSILNILWVRLGNTTGPPNIPPAEKLDPFMLFPLKADLLLRHREDLRFFLVQVALAFTKAAHYAVLSNIKSK